MGFIPYGGLKAVESTPSAYAQVQVDLNRLQKEIRLEKNATAKQKAPKHQAAQTSFVTPRGRASATGKKLPRGPGARGACSILAFIVVSVPVRRERGIDK